MAETNPWRDKYRRALAEQEKLEQTLGAYQGLMARSVNALTTAAEGKDSQLDERLQAIRASAKSNDVAGFERMLKSLDRVLEEADSRQEALAREINQQLATIASQLLPLANDADIKPSVKAFKKELPKSQLIPAALKRQLQTLNNIQQQMIEASPKSSSGLLSRLFTGKEEDTKESDASPAEKGTTKPLATENNEEPKGAISGELVSPSENRSIDTALYRERSLPTSMLDEDSVQAGQEVPTRAALVMIELLDYFKAVPAVEEQAQHVRKKMSHGIRWFELAPTLEQLRDVVFLSYLSADEEYREYLVSLNEELSKLLETIGLSVEKEKQQQQNTKHFTATIKQGVNDIHTTIEQHQETDALKKALENHVQQLQSALVKQEATQAEEEANTDASLSQQLDILVKKVQVMEANEKVISESLAEERKRAITDTLTGLPNREAYNQKLYDEMQRWQRYQHPLSLAVIDIDFFKKINDGYGHQTGDKVLRVVAHFVSKKLREIDFIARFGGEEFVLILPETTTEQSLILLNRIREKLASTPFKTGDEKITVTVSIGVAEFNKGDTCETVFARADEALYEAKQSGRNMCCVG